MDVVIKSMLKRKRSIYIYMAMLCILFAYMPPLSSTIDITRQATYIAILFISTGLHLLDQKDKNWFRLDILFLLGFVIVHFQWAIMYTLSDVDLLSIKYFSHGVTDTIYVNYGTWISTVGILSWFLGYSVFQVKLKEYKKVYRIYYRKLLILTAILFVLFLLTAGNNFYSGGIYKGEGGSSSAEGIGAYIQLIFSISIIALTSVIILNSKYSLTTKFIQWVLLLDKKYLVLTGTYVFLFSLIGDRGAALQIGMTFLILFGSLVRAINIREFCVIVVFGAIIMTLIGLGRSSLDSENIFVSGARRVELRSVYDPTLELAGSARTLYAALESVPERHEYFLGKLWLGNLIGVVPLLQAFYLELTGDEAYELGSSQYITYLRYGSRPPSGEGTSLIADIFLNFGLVGVVLFMFTLGLFIKKLQNELNTQKSYYWIVSAGIFSSVVFYMGRGGLFDGVRPVLWGLLLVMFFCHSSACDANNKSTSSRKLSI